MDTSGTADETRERMKSHTVLIVAGLLASSPAVPAQSGEARSVDTFGWRLSIQQAGTDRLDLIASTQSGAEKRLPLDYLFRTVKTLSVNVDSKAVIVGGTGGSDLVSVIDLVSGKTLDTWACYDASASPDGQFIAYTRFFAKYELVPTSLYLVYDTHLSQLSNRMRNSPQYGDKVTGMVGWAFFPPQGREIRDYDLKSAASDGVHDLHSKLVWIDEQRLTFLDYANGKTSIIVADFRTGVVNSIVRTIPLDERALVNARAVIANARPGWTPAQSLFAESIATSVSNLGETELTINLEPRVGVMRRQIVVRVP